MRKIKFRIWSKEDGCFLCEDSQYLLMDGSAVVPAPWSTIGFSTSKKNYVIEQYTGLKDKKGKEIYEGDVVYVEGRDWLDPGYCAGVYWSDSRALFYIGGCKSPVYTVINDIEVVGDIHNDEKMIG